jgi:hypothetical protein
MQMVSNTLACLRTKGKCKKQGAKLPLVWGFDGDLGRLSESRILWKKNCGFLCVSASLRALKKSSASLYCQNQNFQDYRICRIWKTI